MKWMKFVFLIFLFCWYNNLTAQKSYPLLDEVVYEFFQNYNLTDDKIQSGDKIDFLKKPEGWVLAVVYYDVQEKKMVTKKSMTFWDSKSGKYQDLDFQKAQDRREYLDYYSIYHSFLQINQHSRLNFAIHSYYGYPESNRDVRSNIRYQESMNDTALYSLADAYLEDVFFYTIPDMQKSYDDQMFSDLKLGLKLKKELVEKSPNFKTVVGPIQIKYANDLVGSVYNSRVFYNHPENHNLYHESAYPDGMIEYAKNILKHCPENAILFTNGDNDTYPLIYVQDFLNFRTDVLVINQSLLNRIEMIAYLQQTGLQFVIDPKVYEEEENEVIVLEPSIEHYSLKSFLEKVENGNLAKESYPNTERKFPVGHRSVFFNVKENTIEWKINKARIFRSDLAKLDIILSNFEQRPICFIPGGEDLGLGTYLKREGLILNLDFKEGKTEYEVDQQKMYDNILLKLKTDANDIETSVRNTYYFAFYILIANYLESDNVQMAQRILTRSVEKISFNSREISDMTIYLLDLFLKVDKSNGATNLFQNIVLSGEMDLSQLEKTSSDKWNFNFIENLSRYEHSILLLRKIIGENEILTKNPQYSRLDQYESRLKNLLDRSIDKKPYLKMLVAQHPELMNFVK